jgi:hypothetical protein
MSNDVSFKNQIKPDILDAEILETLGVDVRPFPRRWKLTTSAFRNLFDHERTQIFSIFSDQLAYVMLVCKWEFGSAQECFDHFLNEETSENNNFPRRQTRTPSRKS